MENSKNSLVSAKIYVALTILIFTLASVTACSPSGSKSNGNTRTRYNGSAWSQPTYNSTTGQITQPSYGVISVANVNDLAVNFLAGDNFNPNGFNSSAYSSVPGTTTGFWFNGQIDQNSGTWGGVINMLIFDQTALQTNSPFYWQLTVDEVSSGTIIAHDNSGSVTFQGNGNGVTYSGEVYYQDNNGAQGVLGSFSIQDSFLFN